MERPLTAAEAANELGRDPRTVQRWCNAGVFPNAYRINPEARRSPWMIPPEDVEALKQQEQPNSS